jgi:hypothetical protein
MLSALTSRRITRHGRIALAGALTALVLLLGAPGAQAANNGQQIQFKFGLCVGNKPTQNLPVSVDGWNQNNTHVVWSGVSAPSGFLLRNWWWQGNITVSYYFLGRWMHAYGYVPRTDDWSYEYQYRDLVTMTCGGTLKRETSDWIRTGQGSSSACVNFRSDPSGHYFRMTKYTGEYLMGWWDRTSATGYGIAYGRITPAFIDSSISYPDCG